MLFNKSHTDYFNDCGPFQTPHEGVQNVIDVAGAQQLTKNSPGGHTYSWTDA